ncbi:MBL fold metallo-hydrolase [bacterium AH-315-E07]|nr:MBL fold metallo-hydrolase [bacterium AH-315-E07]
MIPIIEPFFDHDTYTFSYVVSDPESNSCAIIDSVLDYDAAIGRISKDSANAIIEFVRVNKLEVEWILETHAHADHLSAATYLKEQLGGRTGIGAAIKTVQKVFGDMFNAEPEFHRDGSQFNELFPDNASFQIGGLTVNVMHTPGHTPACVTYVFEGSAFVGDTLFMPDYGTARADFPGGDAKALYHSIRRILDLPPETRLHMCHDYGTDERTEFLYLTTVAEQRKNNVQIHEGISVDDFVAFRKQRDAGLKAPRLLLPSVQFNMRGAQLPPAESNGTHYFKIPLKVVQ